MRVVARGELRWSVDGGGCVRRRVATFAMCGWPLLDVAKCGSGRLCPGYCCYAWQRVATRGGFVLCVANWCWQWPVVAVCGYARLRVGSRDELLLGDNKCVCAVV